MTLKAPFLRVQWLFPLITLAGSPLAFSQGLMTVEQALTQCKTKYPSEFESKKRLACFDSIETPALVVSEAQKIKETTGVEMPTAPDRAVAAADDTLIAIQRPNLNSGYLERKWRLTSEGDWDISDFETYKSNYLLVTHNGEPNDTPTSPSHSNSANRDLQNQDLKFQISLKTELMSNLPLISALPYVTSSRLWAAYTQQSYWQFFNSQASRPFRENDYEPELILSLGLDNKQGNLIQQVMPRMLNMGMVHQSNGRDNPLSRSWNRVYLQGGWDLTNNLTLMVRPWWRIPEANDRDDNADISKYMGYGDMNIRWENKAHKLAASVLLRNNLRADNKGFVQLDLQHQFSRDRNINMHLQFSSGYGESLLDYNHYQNVVGLGISLGE